VLLDVAAIEIYIPYHDDHRTHRTAEELRRGLAAAKRYAEQ
jgi:hypothetical protein